MSKPKPNAEIGARIRERREAHGWSRVELADHMQMTPEQIYRWENGHANPVGTTREAVCRLFRIRETWLLTGNGPMLIDPIGTGDGIVGDA